MKRTITAILFLFVLLTNCTRNDEQREFEQRAYSQADGITNTNSLGEVLSSDDDDWQISPLFQGLIRIIPPFPNPARTNQNITFEIDVTGVQSVSGLEVIVWFDQSQFANIYLDNRAPLPPGLSNFQIDPTQLGRFGTIESARGIHRVIIFDGNQQMISYGDIQVE